jgi:hypothetical protein
VQYPFTLEVTHVKSAFGKTRLKNLKHGHPLMLRQQHLNIIHTTNTMSSSDCIEEAVNSRIAAILALRSEIRDPVIPLATMKAIQTVHECLLKSTDQQGWRKVVDWRNKSRPPVAAPRPVRLGGAGGAPPSSAPPVKYASRFKTSGGDDAVLMIIQDKLNRFSPRNYKETHEFLCQILDSGKTHFLKDFMKIIFQKATREESICPHYARLLCELTTKYSHLLVEMIERYKAFSSIFEDISEVETADSYKTLLESNSDKAYRKGYAQFLGELIKYSVLDTVLFVSTLQTIITNINVMATKETTKLTLDEYVACLQRIMGSIQTERTALALELRPVLKTRFLDSLTALSAKNEAFVGVSSRSRFAIMGIVDVLKTF